MDGIQSDGRYEVVVKHYRDGVLHMERFNDLDTAKRWLLRRWAALPVNLATVETYCAAAIYDQRDSRKRIFTIGAHLVDEDRGEKARNSKSQKGNPTFMRPAIR
jgi:hypothetical protein